MAQQHRSHIEPSEHSTDEVDELLRKTEENVDSAGGDGSPAIKPNKELDEHGKPVIDKRPASP